jgi:hypothetical protein
MVPRSESAILNPHDHGRLCSITAVSKVYGKLKVSARSGSKIARIMEFFFEVLKRRLRVDKGDFLE